jgi:allophanate hydrolase subunit 2
MIRIIAPAIATSIQDQGRFGHRTLGYSRSGAMDPQSLETANRIAGALPGAAGLEFGPGTLVIEILRRGTICFGGAARAGAPWWETLAVEPGRRFELTGPRAGMWSYLTVAGGVSAPEVMGSRSTQVREGIGSWITPGAVLEPSDESAAPVKLSAPGMEGPVRLYGNLEGTFVVGGRVDRMGYQLEGGSLKGGKADEWSEPLLPGCIQLPPDGKPFVLMAEGPTVGGYSVPAVVHSDDLRLIAQTQPGGKIDFVDP